MQKHKLLHISLGTHNTEMWRSFDRHFNTRHFDWTQHRSNLHSLNSDVMYWFKTFQPDVVFMQLQSGESLSPQTIREMSKTSITVLWNGDVRNPIPNWEYIIGKECDVTLHTNMEYVKELMNKGVNANYLQVGFDENIFTPEGNTSLTPNVIFLGSNYLGLSSFPLSQLRSDMVRRLRGIYGDGFVAYGNNWDKVQGRERYLNLYEEAIAYRSCKIAINLSHFDYGRYSSDRMLRLMGSGAFCLSHNFEDIGQDFEVGKHLDVWNNLDELIEKIDYYGNRDDERNKIAKEGCEYVRQNYTWNNFVINLKKIIGLNEE